MRIGEFAKAAGIPASVLRLYDKKGLLVPDYIDHFTGYRHYSSGQIEIVRQITLLKQAGFSLKEIKKILGEPDNQKLIRELVERHEAKCRGMLGQLQEAKKTMLQNSTSSKNQNQADQVTYDYGITQGTDKDGTGIVLKSAPLPLPLNQQTLKETCHQLDEEVRTHDFQRISGFMTWDDENGSSAQIVIRVTKLKKDVLFLCEDINLPFENDEQVIGKWKVLQEYAVKEDFFTGLADGWESGHGGEAKEIYFLPDGEDYWVYSWTKDYLILNNGTQQRLCHYHVEAHDGKRYMFVEAKEYEFRRGGNPTVLVLEQADQKRYTKQGIMRVDNLDMPFENDERVLGTWNAYDFIRHREDFEPGKRHMAQNSLYYKKMWFEKDGVFRSQYGEEITGSDAQSWTKGYVLRHYNQTACAYEIVTVDGTDYMLIEWKSGDYRWGGRSTSYYVFVRE